VYDLFRYPDAVEEAEGLTCHVAQRLLIAKREL